VKRFLSSSPLAFTHVPQDVTASKLCKNSMFGNPAWHYFYKISGFISVKKLAPFGYVGAFSSAEISAYFENL
jgi:hypothetical protein